MPSTRCVSPSTGSVGDDDLSDARAADILAAARRSTDQLVTITTTTTTTTATTRHDRPRPHRRPSDDKGNGKGKGKDGKGKD